MQVKNNYDVLWREDGGTASGMGMFNGDIGVVRMIDREIVTVDFDGRVVEYTPDMLGELEPAFAVTVHKAQGAEYRAVILAALDGAPMLLSRSVLYTAITRARELLILVGDEDVVAHMTANDRQQRRYSGLRWRLAQLAFGRVNDAARLALHSEEADLETLDLSAVAELKVTDKGGVEVKLIDRIRALEALYGLLSEEKAEGAGELYRVLTEAAGEEGGWDDG